MFAASFHRSNLHIAALPKSSETQQLAAFLKRRHRRGRGSSIAAAATRPSGSPPACAPPGCRRCRSMPGPVGDGEAGRAGAVPLRRAGGDGGDDRVRHGHRPAGCALRRASGHARQPGNPITSRSAAPAATAPARTRCCCTAARTSPRARHWLAQSNAPRIGAPHPRPAAGGDDPAHRDAAMPHPGLAGLLRRERWARPAAIATPAPIRWAMFDGTVAAQKVLSAIYRNRPVVRGAAHRRRAARASARPMVEKHKPRQAADLGRREGSAGKLLAQRDPPTGGDRRVAAGRRRAGWAGPGAGAGAPDPARRNGGDAAGRPAGAGAHPRTPHPRTRRAESDAPPGLFEALRAWRAAEAKSQAVPPYVIFHDSVLQDIAAVQPDALDVLAQIKGVGASKLERYGEAVLRVLAEQAG